MKRFWFCFSLAVGVLLFVPIFSVLGQGQQSLIPPIISALDKALSEIDKPLRMHAQALKAGDKSKLVDLLDKQRLQLDLLKDKYQKKKTSLTLREIDNDLTEFFGTGADLQTLLKSSKGSFKSAQYSPDPSQCAEHCRQTCGYDSTGEKVCWYTCYYCCGRGGC